MIIERKTQNASFSTDPTAQSLSRFVNARARLVVPEAVSEPASQGTPLPLEILYPSLLRQRPAVAARIAAAAATIAKWLRASLVPRATR
jgi:hypothetical protein